jgi:hypothetical protein
LEHQRNNLLKGIRTLFLDLPFDDGARVAQIRENKFLGKKARSELQQDAHWMNGTAIDNFTAKIDHSLR